MSKIFTSQMHQRATYESLVKDTILEPKDKIALPNRQASILRIMQQLTRYDESEFLDLDRDNENILKERIPQAQVQKIVAIDPSGSIAEQTAKNQTSLTYKVLQDNLQTNHQVVAQPKIEHKAAHQNAHHPDPQYNQQHQAADTHHHHHQAADRK